VGQTQCSSQPLLFQDLDGREVRADFSGGRITSYGGGLLLRHVEEGRRILARLAECFEDHRDPDAIEHSVSELLAQRVYAIALGYEDVNDHDELRRDSLLAALAGKADITGAERARKRDEGIPLAGKSTINRLEWAICGDKKDPRYHRVECRPEEIDRLLVDVFLEAHRRPPKQIVLDVDATDDPLHGNQEGRFFHGYYDCYCYLPLYIFCGDHLLCARLRPSNIDASAGSVDELKRIVGQIRRRWPRVQVIVRGDSGFAREEIMAWCESEGVDYVFGLAKNPRLIRSIGKQLEQARRMFIRTEQPARYFRDFSYRTLDSWSRKRRVVGKAEHLRQGANPRFIVTSLRLAEFEARSLYEDLYCARGEMENRIKEQQLYLFADRTSSTLFNANQMRLWFSSFAYLLVSELRRLGLAGTELARAQCSTIREKLFKIGAFISVSVRRVWVRLASSCPYQEIFRAVYSNLNRALYPIRV